MSESTCHNLPVCRSEADRSAGLIKEEYETRAGRTEAPTARSPVAGTVELVKPLHAQWPSSDEPRAKAMSLIVRQRSDYRRRWRDADCLRTKQSGCWLSSNEVAPLTLISEFGGGKCSRRRRG